MTLTKKQQVWLLAALLTLLLALNVFQRLRQEPQRTAPLVYERGMTVAAPLRRGVTAREEKDPLAVMLARRGERFPGVSRDLFRMQGDGTVRKTTPAPVTAAVPTVTAPTPTVPQRTPEEIAADQARADLSKFRLLGYLTDKDSSLFLSKDGELFIAKSGDTLLKTYRVKEAGKDFVVLQDTTTRVEVRIELTGGGGK